MPKKKKYKTAQTKAASRSAKRTGNFDLDDLEETETSLWVHEQLTRIRELLCELEKPDEEMINAIDYLIEDNDRWISPEIAGAIRSKLSH